MTITKQTINNQMSNLKRWERHTEWPLAIVSIIFLVGYSVRVINQPHGIHHHLITVIMAVSWVAFVIDYVVHLWLSVDRFSWFLRHLPELAILVFPFLQPLRLIRILILVEVLQHAISKIINGRVAIYTILTAVLVVYTSSLAELQVERNAPGATLTSFSKTVWWAIITITTVGYGDEYPVTATGRVIAALLVMSGITLMGMITATITSWITNRVSLNAHQTMSVASHQYINPKELAALRHELASLRQQLHTLTLMNTPQQNRDVHPNRPKKME